MCKFVCIEVVNINQTGLTVRHTGGFLFIDFQECVQNYQNEISSSTNNCVAQRNVTQLSFTFFTNPKTELIFKRRFLSEWFAGTSAIAKFHALQLALNANGYTSYDLS